MDGTAHVFLAGSRGRGDITGEAGHLREPGDLEASAPLGLAVNTLLRGKQIQPSWDGGVKEPHNPQGRE